MGSAPLVTLDLVQTVALAGCVLFLGYGDNRELDEREDWRPSGRQLFVKLSYAFQG